MTSLQPILIVDDSAVAAELLRRTLVRAGYTVSIAYNGEEGLQAARAQRPALVMSDINMPLMNGYQLCRAIKTDDELWNVPMMLLSKFAATSLPTRNSRPGKTLHWPAAIPQTSPCP